MIRWVVSFVFLLGVGVPLRAQEQIETGKPPVSTAPPVAETETRAVKRVVPPKLIYSVDPKFSEKARRKKISGAVIVALTVDEQGVPQNVHVGKRRRLRAGRGGYQSGATVSLQAGNQGGCGGQHGAPRFGELPDFLGNVVCGTSKVHPMRMRISRAVTVSLLAVLAMVPCAALTGCIVAGGSSSGGFFIFPSVGVLFLILIIFLVMRRR